MILILFLLLTNKYAGDENIKQDVGALTEGMAASTPQSSKPSVPEFFAHEVKESGPSFNQGSRTIKTNLNTNDHKSGVCNYPLLLYS